MKYLLLAGFIITTLTVRSQSVVSLADSIRRQYQIPGMAFAVVSSDSVLACHSIGVQRMNKEYPVKAGDRFHIGSNTKAITAFIAALLVKENKLQWNTTFLSMFPELRWRTRYVYDTVTLANLLTFRGRVQGYTYTSSTPAFTDLHGDYAAQRKQLAANFLTQSPMKLDANKMTPSNVDYIMAGLMLEKAAGKPYKELVADLGRQLHIDFQFDYPNLKDTLQPWGHNEQLQPLRPSVDYKMNWLLAAGNINVSLEDYLRFIQLPLKGLKGKSALLPQQTFEQLLYSMPVFSYGWFNETDQETGHHIAANEGNAGAFITKVQVIREADRAYIIFTNVSSAAAQEGIAVLLKALSVRYGR
ncbi:serine hydrolase domain-containing protein [Chitinophaga rhizophila]|uniref:Beta-lactamase family protein n=1 Tax=Chitinophaga rhizophila TaxID=2866212 RepID=A0ABS7GLD5_9BACT|nr:serine hydrolase domain-containing protein [Chitinophaga rhizophila]MBW8687584.1 beta-lactamase family protein [Chitinophaga rhizophila]